MIKNFTTVYDYPIRLLVHQTDFLDHYFVKIYTYPIIINKVCVVQKHVTVENSVKNRPTP